LNGEFDCNGTPSQLFRQNITTGQIKSVLNGKCLDSTNEPWVFQDCDPNKLGQQFSRDGGMIRSSAKPKNCLDLGNKNHNAGCAYENNNQEFLYKPN
jgi:hypothetical protein